MNVMVRLLSFYEWARHKKESPLGKVFPYKGGRTGLQMLAEFIVRVGEQNLAALVFPSHRRENITFLPNGAVNSGFVLDNKIEELFEENNFVIIIQREMYLSTGNYVALKIPYDGDKVKLYHIKKNDTKVRHVADFDLSYLDDHTEILKKAFEIVVEEVEFVLTK